LIAGDVLWRRVSQIVRSRGWPVSELALSPAGASRRTAIWLGAVLQPGTGQTSKACPASGPSSTRHAQRRTSTATGRCVGHTTPLVQREVSGRRGLAALGTSQDLAGYAQPANRPTSSSRTLGCEGIGVRRAGQSIITSLLYCNRSGGRFMLGQRSRSGPGRYRPGVGESTGSPPPCLLNDWRARSVRWTLRPRCSTGGIWPAPRAL
jgi:hypothetical protein